MALNLPPLPHNEDDTFTSEGVTYVFKGDRWIKQVEANGLDDHLLDLANPHQVTIEQLGGKPRRMIEFYNNTPGSAGQYPQPLIHYVQGDPFTTQLVDALRWTITETGVFKYEMVCTASVSDLVAWNRVDFELYQGPSNSESMVRSNTGHAYYDTPTNANFVSISIISNIFVTAGDSLYARIRPTGGNATMWNCSIIIEKMN